MLENLGNDIRSRYMYMPRRRRSTQRLDSVAEGETKVYSQSSQDLYHLKGSLSDCFCLHDISSSSVENHEAEIELTLPGVPNEAYFPIL